MSVQQQEQPIGQAMWGGKAWDAKIAPDGAPVGRRAPQLPPGFVTALISIVLVLGGGILAAVGAGVAFGAGVGMLVGGGIAVLVGILLGVSK